MKVYNFTMHPKGIIFDIDSTLYDCPEYAAEQVDIQVRHFAHLRGMTAEAGRAIINRWRSEWSAAHGGKKISLGNTLVNFGIPIEESIKWRRMLLCPAFYLHRDDSLRKCLASLKAKYRLICVTNNPVLPARKTLEALGVDDILSDIVGLDTCGKSKPAVEPFSLALKVMGIKANECVSIGDRYDMDISLPLEMGMAGILVDSAADVLKAADSVLL